MEIIKLVHITTALLSIFGFIIRGIWMMKESALLHKKWVKITPHIVDTLLLLSAIMLAVSLALNPLEHDWLLSKIIALVVYIGLGLFALKLGKTLAQRKLAWISAILVFIYILFVALTKQSFPY